MMTLMIYHINIVIIMYFGQIGKDVFNCKRSYAGYLVVSVKLLWWFTIRKQVLNFNKILIFMFVLWFELGGLEI